jgi:cell division protein FtsL
MQKIISLLTNPAAILVNKKEEAVKPRSSFGRQVVVRSIATVKAPTRTQAKATLLNPTSTMWIAWLLVALNVAMFLTYLFSVNIQANTGYTVKQLQKRISEQETVNKKLTMQVAEANSIAAVQESADSSRFVPITAKDTIYVQFNQLSQR